MVEAKVMVIYLSIVEVVSPPALKEVIGSEELSYLLKGIAVAKEARLKSVAIGTIIINVDF